MSPFPLSPGMPTEGMQRWKAGREEGDNAEEERRMERMMDDVRTSLSKEQQGENEK